MPQSRALPGNDYSKFLCSLSLNDRNLLDTSCAGSFMKKTIEFKWGLLERIKCNSEDWELNKGKESGIKLKYDYIIYGYRCFSKV